jgi:lysozyme
MYFSAAGLALLKRSEGLRLFVYRDAAGLPTIGYGHKLTPGEHYPKGITEAEAFVLLDKDLSVVEKFVASLVHVTLTQGQFDALVDFVYNLGYRRLAGSTLLRDLNAGNYDLVPKQLLLWDHGDMHGKEVELKDLKARRQAEAKLWTTTQASLA